MKAIKALFIVSIIVSVIAGLSLEGQAQTKGSPPVYQLFLGSGENPTGGRLADLPLRDRSGWRYVSDLLPA